MIVSARATPLGFQRLLDPSGEGRPRGGGARPPRARGQTRLRKVKKKQRKLTDLVDYELKRPDLKFLDGPKGKVITTLPGELTPAQVLKTKKEG